MDDTDRQILQLLRRDGRAPVSEIARRVGLSAAPCARRIERMEKDGVIRGYAAIVDDGRAGMLQALTEIRLLGATDSGEIQGIAESVPEIEESYSVAGTTDAFFRLRVRDVEHLQQVIDTIRRTGKVEGTRTCMVIRTWTRPPELPGT
ncbi:Lrp/AsnC family transcriptional regulator [Kitasatospora sp. NPDC088134]|uniref:Lrp/AsnC family transcriptional regulator n=1 Tax=Kitasatospora sp. NPDC088134 TaxID=3364071 RepID=UPI0038045735